MSNSDTWFVTGAAGFIGSNLSSYLLKSGQQVVGFDNFFSGRRQNIDRLQQQGGSAFRFIEGDIRDKTQVLESLVDCGTVAHLAGQVSVTRSLDDPLETNSINAEGFLSMILTAAEAKVARFIYASSCTVYGDNPALPLTETEIPRPLSPLAVSKLSNELYAKTLGPRLSGMKIYGFRFFNIFGPWQDPASGYAAVIPLWTRLMLSGKQPIMYGVGDATRDFCFVDNICEVLAKVGAPQGSLPTGLYNLATGQRTSLLTLYATLRRVLARFGVVVPHEKPEPKPWRPGEILHSCGGIALATEKLGYMPRITLEEGLARVLTEEYALKPQGSGI